MDHLDRPAAYRRATPAHGRERGAPSVAACFAPPPRRGLLDELDSLLRDLLGPETQAGPRGGAPAGAGAQRSRGKFAGLKLWVGAALAIVVLLLGLAAAWLTRGQNPAEPAAPRDEAVRAIVERIILAESNGDSNAKNKRSSATGAAQFLEETWLRMVRLHRPDLARHSERDVLELRRDPDLAREITARFAERNAALLVRRGFAVTPGRLYLSHFAGGGGAVAILLAPDEADAATVMAAADASGRTTREKIVKANPFLERFTVAAIKRWADRRMCPRATGVHAANGVRSAPACDESTLSARP